MCDSERLSTPFLMDAKAALSRRLPNGKCATPEDRVTVDKYNAMCGELAVLKKRRGKRYEDCTLENYVSKSALQTDIVAKLRDYALHSDENIKIGKNVILFGPKGTGKDHLLMSLSKAVAVQTGSVSRWENGIDLFDKIRADEFGKRRPLELHDEHFRYSIDADIFWISDPLPPTGSLSEFDQRSFFKIIDKRYSQCKPTWLTLNVADGKEAESRMGSQTVDRLRHDALMLFCNWPSFRENQ
jgi:DNA replication protein DnaC